jgi:uncharacterized protein YdeI (YjbR/CyaY-like superfamily)
MNTGDVDSYLRDGCGRCALYRTPECKVHRWTDVLVALRSILRDEAFGLTETLKWGAPCYMVGDRNVLQLTALKPHAVLSFFDGELLNDPAELLERPGPNTREGRVLRFTTLDEVSEREAAVVSLVEQAIAVARTGPKKRAAPKPVEVLPIELQAVLDAHPEVASAFDALTPGRQRSYVLYVSGAKQAKTRIARAERAVPKIVAGKGWNER